MATISERLAYVLTLDISSGVKSLEKFGKTADKEIGRADQRLDKVGANMSKFGAGAVAFAGLAGAGLAKMAMGASDLAESVNAVNVTFGEASSGILKLGEDAARSVGLSAKDFNGLAVQFSSFAKTVAGDGGDVVATMDDLTTRAADFASVMNLDVADAARVFQSGLAGETEPLKKFGVDLSAASVQAYALANGITNSAASMTEAEKVQARYGLLMESTAQTAGDFANTSDGMANQQRILAAEFENLTNNIGAGVLPMLTEVVSVATKITGAFSSLSPEAQATAGRFAAITVAGVGLVGTISMVAGQVIKMRDRFTAADGTLNKFGKTAKGASLALAGVGLATAAAEIVNEIQDVAGKAARNVEELNVALAAMQVPTDAANTMKEFGDVVRGFDEKIILPGHLWEDFGKKIEIVGTEGKRSIEDIDRGFKSLLESSGPAAAQKLLDAWRIQNETLDQSSGKYKDNAELIERYQSRLDLTAASVEAVTAITDEANAEIEEQAALLADTAAQWQEWADATNQAAEDAVKAYETQVDAANDWADGIRDAINGGSQSIADIAVDTETSASEMIAALQAHTAAAAFWEANLATTMGNVTSGTEAQKADFIAYLAEMGAAGAPMVAELASDQDKAQALFDEWVKMSEVTGDGLVAGFDPVAEGLKEKIQQADGKLYQQLLVSRAKAKIEARKIGDAIPDGVELGIEQGQGDLNDTITAMVDAAVLEAKEAAGIRSPSRLFAEQVGVPIVEGIAEGVAEEGAQIGDALARAIDDAEGTALDAAQDLVDNVTDSIDDMWGGIDTKRSVADLRDSVADAAAKLKQVKADPKSSRADITSAEERLADANYNLAKATTSMITADAKSRESWIKTAKAAGLTNAEISGLVAKYDTLSESMRTAAKEAEAIRAEAEAAREVRDSWAWYVNNGLVGQDRLDAASKLSGDPNAQIDYIKSAINDIRKANGLLPQYADGGVVPGPPSQGQLAVVHGGETIIPAGKSIGGTPISLTVNAGMGADGNRIGSEIVRYLREWERHNGPGWRS